MDSQGNENAATAAARGEIYGLLANVFRAEPTSAFLSLIKGPFSETLNELGASLGGAFAETLEDALAEELAIEYTALFLGPGGHLSPHESVNTESPDGKRASLWGERTAQVKSFIETAGLEYRSDFDGMPDHITAELEFMQALMARQAEALDAGDDDGAEYCRGIAQRFLNEHLGAWVPDFCDRVISKTQQPYFKEMAGVTKAFVEYELSEAAGTA